MKITYGEFADYLMRDGYKEPAIRHLFGALKAMDRESRSWVIKWFFTGIYPRESVEGVTAEYLVQECGYSSLNAFIALDWLKADPETAKYYILHTYPDITPGESVNEEMKAFLQSKGVEADYTEQEVDLKDLEEE